MDSISPSPSVNVDDGAACEACGRYGVVHIGDRLLCLECYHGCGSCCPEFGKDDLWRFEEDAVSDRQGTNH